MSFKKDLHNIDIPPNLSERTKQGIQQAEKEKKKLSIWPTISTIIVTAAMLLFVFNFEKLMPTNTINAAQPKNDEFLHSYSLVILFTSVVFFITLYLTIKKKLRLRWTIILTIATLSISFNISEYQKNKLVEPYIVPIFMPEATNKMTLYYFVNKDESLHIDRVFMNNKALDVIEPSDVSLYDLPAKEQFKNHQLKAVFVHSNEEDLSKLLAEETSFLTVGFNNDKFQQVNFKPYQKLKEREQIVDQIHVSYGQTSADIYHFQTRLQLTQPINVTSLEFPDNMVNHFSMRLSVTPFDEAKNDWNFAETKNYYNFVIPRSTTPMHVSFNKGDLIEIVIGNMAHSKRSPLLEDIITIQTDTGEIPIVINDHNYLRHYEEMLPIIIERQRGEKNE